MKTAGRYDIRSVLGEGGMGIVYRAFDPVVKREVTLKTLKNAQDPVAIDLFRREWTVLSSLAHPNIVEIYDIGEIDEPAGKKPYFVMPLLRGSTLDKLISGSKLTTERSIHIMSQICKGLQAAHEQGLVHRDLKPSNLFVLEDDSVKIIDFGVAHMMDKRSTVSAIKGTPPYMAPEQLTGQKATPQSDQFSIAAVCYEMLAHRHPFWVPGQDPAERIKNDRATPIYELNASVSPLISRVVNKALAKDPLHRFADVREFSNLLQKALRNEPIDIFDDSKLDSRLERARKALADDDIDFAADIIRELDDANYLHPDIQQIHQDVEQRHLQRKVAQLLEAAQKRHREKEYGAALQKIAELRSVDPSNTQAATLEATIENERSVSQIEGSLGLARQHLENRAYDLARRELEKILQLRPNDARAQALRSEVDRKEQDSARVRNEKEKAYQAARALAGQGDLSAALSKLESILEAERRAPDTTPQQSATYQKLYEDVRVRHDKLQAQGSDVRRLMAEGNLISAHVVCEEVLQQYPANIVFTALKLDIEAAQSEQISAYIAKAEKEVASEPDMNRKVAMLEAARQKYPNEDRFSQLLLRVQTRRDIVMGIVAKATTLEEASQFGDALGQWEILRTTYPQQPGLEVEIERLKHRLEHQKRSGAKGNWVIQIDDALAMGDFLRAELLTDEAMAEFKGDAELEALKKNAQRGAARTGEALEKLDEGRRLVAAGAWEEGFEALRAAANLNPRSQEPRDALAEALLARGRALLDTGDWRAAEPLAAEARQCVDGPLTRTLQTLIKDRREEEGSAEALGKARELQGHGQIRDAILVLDRALELYPRRERLVQVRASLIASLPPAERADMRQADLQEAKQMAAQAEMSVDAAEKQSIWLKSKVLKTKYENDNELEATLTVIENRARPEAPGTTSHINVSAKADAEAKSTPAAGSEKIRQLVEAGRELAQRVFAAIKGRGLRPELRPLSVYWPAAAFVILFGAALLWPKPPRANVSLQGTTAAVRVLDSAGHDVTSKLKQLPGGDYRLIDGKAGFDRLDQSFHINPDANRNPVVVAAWHALSAETPQSPSPPAAQYLVIGGSVATTYIIVDGDASGKVPIQPGQEYQHDLTEGSHTVETWVAADQHAGFTASVQAGAPAVISAVTRVGDPVVIVSSLGAAGRIYASPAAVLALDGMPLGNGVVNDGGVDLPPLQGEKHTLRIALGNSAVQKDIVFGPGRVLAVYLKPDPTLSDVLVTTIPDEVSLQLTDGKGTNRAVVSRGKQARFSNLHSGSYTLVATKNGYVSKTNVIDLDSGKSITSDIELSPVIVTSSVTIRSTPGATVSFAGRQLVVPADGAVTARDLAPGNNVPFEAKLAGWRTVSKQVSLRAGDNPSFDLSLTERLLGKILLRRNPGNSSVAYRRSGDQTFQDIGFGLIELPEGPYELRAEAAGYVSRIIPVAVKDGETAEPVLTLEPETPVPKPVDPVKTFGIDCCSGPGWTDGEGGARAHTKGIAAAGMSPGTFAFTIGPLKGRFRTAKMRWQIGNIHFEVDGDHYSSIIPGKPSTDLTRNLPIKKQEKYQFRINSTNNELTVSLFQDGQWKELEKQTELRDKPVGAFSFLDQIQVFAFQRTGR